MGLLWDLIQQNQISEQSQRSSSLEERVEQLESDLRHTRQLLQVLLQRLETHLGEDLDRDGQVG